MDHGRLERLLSALHGTDESAPVLRRICVVCSDTTTMAGAGVSRIVHGRHETLSASDDIAERVERLQVTTSEGPCLEVIASFRPVFEPDLGSTRALERWPSFARAALDLDIVAVFAFPLVTEGVAIGALDVYSRTTGGLHTEQVRDALVLADLAALAIDHYDAPAGIEGVAISVEAAEPWAHPAIVHNASGMVSEQLDIDVDEALLRLRAVAFATERTVANIARDVIDRRLRLESWSDRD